MSPNTMPSASSIMPPSFFLPTAGATAPDVCSTPRIGVGADTAPAGGVTGGGVPGGGVPDAGVTGLGGSDMRERTLSPAGARFCPSVEVRRLVEVFGQFRHANEHRR